MADQLIKPTHTCQREFFTETHLEEKTTMLQSFEVKTINHIFAFLYVTRPYTQVVLEPEPSKVTMMRGMIKENFALKRKFQHPHSSIISLR